VHDFAKNVTGLPSLVCSKTKKKRGEKVGRKEHTAKRGMARTTSPRMSRASPKFELRSALKYSPPAWTRSIVSSPASPTASRAYACVCVCASFEEWAPESLRMVVVFGGGWCRDSLACSRSIECSFSWRSEIFDSCALICGGALQCVAVCCSVCGVSRERVRAREIEKRVE